MKKAILWTMGAVFAGFVGFLLFGLAESRGRLDLAIGTAAVLIVLFVVFIIVSGRERKNGWK